MTWNCIVLWMIISMTVSMLIGVLGSMFYNQSSSCDVVECFECGIDPIEQCRIPFALHFFLVAAVFVVFDSELLVSLPIMFPPVSSMFSWFWLLYLVLLYLGTVLEVVFGSIDWNE